jgi:WD40 repeat protein
MSKLKKEKARLKSTFVQSCITYDHRTLIQLIDYKTKEVLDSITLEKFRGKPGIYCLRAVKEKRIIGIYANKLLVFSVINNQMTDFYTLNIPGVKLLDTQDMTKNIVLVFNDNSVEIGYLNTKKQEYQCKARFRPRGFEESEIDICAVEYHSPTSILASAIDGQVIEYKSEKFNEWILEKSYYKHSSKVKSIQSCKNSGVVALYPDDENLLLVDKEGKKIKEHKIVTEKKKQEKLEKKDAGIVSMDFIGQNLIYSKKDGKLGRITVD